MSRPEKVDGCRSHPLEVERYTEELERKGLDFKTPSAEGVHGRKYYDLGRLVEGNENIVCTHALFRMLN